MAVLKRAWQWWKRIGVAIGTVVSTIVLGIFYYTIFALFAIPFAMFGKSVFGLQGGKDGYNWTERRVAPRALKDFEQE